MQNITKKEMTLIKRHSHMQQQDARIVFEVIDCGALKPSSILEELKEGDL